MFNKNKLLAIILVINIALLFTACSQMPNENVESTSPVQKDGIYTVKIVDSYNREVVIESEPMRVISIAPSITETIFALGAGDKLVGRTDYCTYPEKVKDIQSIGSLQEPSIEKIIDLKPDLVIASTHFKEDVLKKLEEAGIKVVIFFGEESFNGVYEVIEKVGLVINKKDEADLLITDMKDRVEKVLERVKDLEKPEVYYVLGFGEYGDFTAGSGTFIGNMLEMAGGKNAAADVEGWKYSLEKLVEKDPYLLICPMDEYSNKEKLMESNGYKDLTAVKEGRVYEIDTNLLQVQGPRLIDGLEILAEIIHPTK